MRRRREAERSQTSCERKVSLTLSICGAQMWTTTGPGGGRCFPMRWASCYEDEGGRMRRKDEGGRMNSHNLFTKGEPHDGKRSARTHETVCSKDHQTLCCLTLTWCGQGFRAPSIEGWDVCWSALPGSATSQVECGFY